MEQQTKINGHALIRKGDGHQHNEDEECPTCDWGLSVCRDCGTYEAGLDQPCTAKNAKEMEQQTKNLMLALIAEIQRYLDDAITTGDPALLEELAARSRDVLAVYHRKGRAVPPELFTFSDGITRNISRVAFECALATAYEEWDAEKDFREFMEGQER